MKDIYETPKMQIVHFVTEDVITVSNGNDDNYGDLE